MKTRLLARFAAALAVALPLAALAGGPLVVCNGAGVKYPTNSVTLNYDQGTLGPLSKSSADALVTSAVSLWTNVSTATITINRGSDLAFDVTASNYLTYYSQFSDGINPVIYDTDGTIIDTILGGGASDSVLGFAGSASFGPPTCAYAEGQAVMSGKLLTLGAITQAQMSNVITHEIGHLIGMDHTQLDSAQGLATSNYPMMYPIAYRTSNTLHEDDASAVSALYPDPTANTTYGTLSGTFTTAGGSPLPGANIWAQGTGGTFSVVSDYLGAGTGAFQLLLPPGTYTLHAQAIETQFTGGSGVGPYSNDLTDVSFQPPLYSGANGAGTPLAVTFGTTVTITAGCSGSVAFHIDGTGTVSGNCSLTPPVAPTTVSPTGTITSTTPTYTWNAVSGATSYYLLVQNTSGVAVSQSVTAAVAGCPSGTGTCTFTPTAALTPGATYNWFVNASNAGGTSPWSAARTITVSAGSVPLAPTLISPSGTITTLTPTYTWNASAGATSYNFFVLGPTGFLINTSYAASAVGCGTGTGTCTVTPTTPLLNSTAYSWSVSATNAAGTSPTSASLNITTNAAVAGPPPAPTLVSPSGTITTTTPTYTWNASSGATSYHLQVQNTAGVAVSQNVTPTAAGCATTSTCTFTPTTALGNGTSYNWFVNATNANGTSAWSAGNAITVSAAGPSVPATPVTISPSGTTTTTTPTYTWNASATATSYYLLVQNTAGVAVSQSVSATAAGCGAGTGTCSFTPTSALANGASYNWFVNATNSIGTSAWSAARGITVSAAGPSVPSAPVPISPTGTVTTNTPTYTWNASAGATSYYLLAQNTAGVAVSLSVTASAAGCASGGTCSFTPTSALSNGATYNWFVNASNSLGTSPWSAATTITVSASGPSVPLAPTQIAPTGATGTRTPTYSWNASTGATSYYLLVQNTAGVAVSLSLPAATAGCGSGGTCSYTPSTSLAAATTYVWFVNASNSLGTSAWSAGKTINTP